MQSVIVFADERSRRAPPDRPRLRRIARELIAEGRLVAEGLLDRARMAAALPAAS